MDGRTGPLAPGDRMPLTCGQGHHGVPPQRICEQCGQLFYRPCLSGHWMPAYNLLCPRCGARPLEEPPADPGTVPAAPVGYGEPGSATVGAAAAGPAPRRRPALLISLLVVALVGGAGVVVVITTGSSSTNHPATAPTNAPTQNPSATTPIVTLPGLVAHPAPAVSAACQAAPGPAGPGGHQQGPAGPGGRQQSPAATAPPKPAAGHAVSDLPAPVTVPFPSGDGSSPHYTRFSVPPPFCIDVQKTYVATMRTDLGTVVVDLFPQDSPVTVNNFVFLAGYHFYDGIVFHRVIRGFVDQGGDPTGTGRGGPGYQFGDELPQATAAYDPGALAMANAGPNTNGSQFFIVVGSGGQQLTLSYAVFGQVVSGLDVVNRINADGSGNTLTGSPRVLHRIESVTISSQ